MLYVALIVPEGIEGWSFYAASIDFKNPHNFFNFYSSVYSSFIFKQFFEMFYSF